MNSIEQKDHNLSLNHLSSNNTETSGRVGKLLLRWLGKESEIVSVEHWSERFKMIELQGDALKGIHWNAGQKIQIPLAGMRLARTYTPIIWDAQAGKTKFLVFTHGNAPGSNWAKTVALGSRYQIIGPRRSIDISNDDSPVLIFGDETVFGLVAALQHSYLKRRIDALFEVENSVECQPIIDRLHLRNVSLNQRHSDESHLETMGNQIISHLHQQNVLVLAGRALAIQRIKQKIKQYEIKSSRIHTKAYWAAGKTGLD